MPFKDDNLLARLLATFKVEAREHIQAISSALVDLEKASTPEARSEIIEATFRSAHSLKGAARAVDVTEIEALCQPLESVFAALKRSQIDFTPELFDLLHQVVGALDKQLQALEASPHTPHTLPAVPVSGLVHALQSALEKKPLPALPKMSAMPQDRPVAPAPTPAPVVDIARDTSGTVRVSTAKLDAVLLQAEEMLSSKLAATEHAAKLRQLQARPSEWEKMWTKLRPDVRVVQRSAENKESQSGGLQATPHLKRVAEFLEWNRNFIETLETEIGDLATVAARDRRATGAMLDNLLDEMKKVVMQPFSTLLDVFPRFVRELSREQGKEVDLVIQGGEIEIDRRILEEMKDPLIHLVRNSIDHGIEIPGQRVQKGKGPRGRITIGISPRNGSNVELLITDDGAGIDAGKVKGAALKLGIIAPEKVESLGEKEALSLACFTGVSTSPMITDISGRGIGLAIVKEKTEKLNGTFSIESELGKGAVFHIVLPLTLARFRGIVIRVDRHLFVLPTSNVERAVRVRNQDVKTVENRETISLAGQAISLARLGEVLELPQKNVTKKQPEFLPAIVLASEDQRIAFIVDEIINEQEVLVKTLPKQLGRVPNIAGATVLGTGRVVPILNVPELIKSAVRASGTGAGIRVVSPEVVQDAKKSVLVAEDSITSRTLLKNILETAGYEVTTAVDGVDAFTKLRNGGFELVVSDVDMPRMNGFGLTAKIRGDKALAALPVILVTALDSREDREHGMDVGASAYIVKGSFDQSNLLETMKRLI